MSFTREYLVGRPDLVRRVFELAGVDFANARRNGKELTIQCPFHDDEHPSLDINISIAKYVCRACGAGGDAIRFFALRKRQTDGEAIAELRERLSLNGASAGATSKYGRIVATYDYRDEDGKLLYQTVRYEPKDFSQRRPDGKGGWIRHLDCPTDPKKQTEDCRQKRHERVARRVLYHLPELLEADPDAIVWKPAGEKDVDNLVSLGEIATTNSGGEGKGKWKAEYAEPFRGHHVVILPHNDAVGAEHGEEVARSLYGVAASVRVVDLPGLPEKGDVSDFLAAGHTIEELRQLATAAPKWKPQKTAHLAEILSDVAALLRRYVSIKEEAAIVFSLWTVHTYCFAAAEATPYLHITSPERRCGKTLILELLELLVARPWLTGRTSAAALVRKIHADAPTLLLDESDAAFSGPAEYAEALRGILNTGYRRSGKASLCIGQGTAISVKDFSTFCPKAIAGIGQLPDTVADRCIPIRLKRKTKGDPVERFGPRAKKAVRPIVAALRSSIEQWTAENLERLFDAEPSLPEALGDRAQDVAEPLLALAEAAEGNWPKATREAIVALCADRPVEDDSLGVRLLRDCRVVFDARSADRLSSAGLSAALLAIEDAPWSELDKRPLTPHRLARLLNPFGIAPGTIRLDDGTTAKGYYRAAFEESWRRYLPTEADLQKTDEGSLAGPQTVTASQANAGGGFLHFSKRHKENLVTDEKRGIVNTDGPCDDVTFRKPLGGGKAKALTPPRETWEAPPGELAEVKRLLSADGLGWAVVESGSGNGNVLLVRDPTVKPPAHLSHLRRYLVPELGEEMVPARDSQGAAP